MTARGGDTWVVLRRSCPAATVPDGQPVELSEGGRVQVVQQRGGSITLRTEMGTLLRIDAEHADAVGLEAPERRVVVGPDQPFHLDLVTEALGTVYDPEIPISIVDLGLVYRCDEVVANGSRRIEIDMTMTAPGCGMGDVLRADALRAVQAIPAVDEVDVQIVFDPPWNIGRMSEAARLQLGLM